MAAGIEEVGVAIAETAPLVRQFADAYPAFREIGKRMLTAWEVGMLDIQPSVGHIASHEFPRKRLPSFSRG
jgi:hypothetical protein